MPDRVVLDTGVIFAIYFKGEASSQKDSVENDPITSSPQRHGDTEQKH
jgi:hypothetical protein